MNEAGRRARSEHDQRDARDPRGPEDERDPRDPRLPDDPRDPRDPPTPRSIEETDQDLRSVITAYHRLRWIALGVLATMLTLAVIVGGYVIYHQHLQLATVRDQVKAGCSFFADLSRVPINPVPPVVRPSKLGVSIVVDSHFAAEGLGCPNVQQPDKTVQKWADYYHIRWH